MEYKYPLSISVDGILGGATSWSDSLSPRNGEALNSSGKAWRWHVNPGAMLDSEQYSMGWGRALAGGLGEQASGVFRAKVNHPYRPARVHHRQLLRSGHHAAAKHLDFEPACRVSHLEVAGNRPSRFLRQGLIGIIEMSASPLIGSHPPRLEMRGSEINGRRIRGFKSEFVGGGALNPPAPE